MRLARTAALLAPGLLASALLAACTSGTGGDSAPEPSATGAPTTAAASSSSASAPSTSAAASGFSAVLPDAALVPSSYEVQDLTGESLQVVVEGVLGTSPYFTSEPEGCLTTAPFDVAAAAEVVGVAATDAANGSNLSILVGPTGPGLADVAARMAGCTAATFTIALPEQPEVTASSSIDLPAPPEVPADETLAIRSTTTVGGAPAGGSLVYLATVGDTAIMVNGIASDGEFADPDLLLALLTDAVARA